jgi:hypothetical protein
MQCKYYYFLTSNSINGKNGSKKSCFILLEECVINVKSAMAAEVFTFLQVNNQLPYNYKHNFNSQNSTDYRSGKEELHCCKIKTVVVLCCIKSCTERCTEMIKWKTTLLHTD